jgi:hypothetical protein
VQLVIFELLMRRPLQSLHVFDRNHQPPAIRQPDDEQVQPMDMLDRPGKRLTVEQFCPYIAASISALVVIMRAALVMVISPRELPAHRKRGPCKLS